MGAVFGLFAGFYYWIGKITGKQYNEFWGQVHFWTMFIGVNITFFPMHFLGLNGMPRRIPDYPDAYIQWNVISSFGSIISTVSTVVFLYGIYLTFTQSTDKILSHNYWYVPSFFSSSQDLNKNLTTEIATSLEWVLPNPPAFHAFNHLPVQS
jgi:heme/copper-type cytochrome/quinol oxidase subunit 1